MGDRIEWDGWLKNAGLSRDALVVEDTPGGEFEHVVDAVAVEIADDRGLGRPEWRRRRVTEASHAITGGALSKLHLDTVRKREIRDTLSVDVLHGDSARRRWRIGHGDQDRVGGGRPRRSGKARRNPRARAAEVARVGHDRGDVGVANTEAERAAVGVDGVSEQEGRQKGSVFHSFDPGPKPEPHPAENGPRPGPSRSATG